MIDKAEAIKLSKEVNRLAAKNNGRLLAEAVVEAAQNPKHFLHKKFEWDNQKAGHLHRLEQARALIRTVKVVVTNNERSITTVAYRRDPRVPVKEQGYVHIDELFDDKDLAREILVDEFALAASALRRARDTAAALEMAEEIDAILEVVSALSTRASGGANATN